MKTLKFRNEEKTKYVEDILDTDLVGLVNSLDQRIIIVLNSSRRFIGLNKEYNGKSQRWSEKSKSEYIKQFKPKPKEVILFDNEAEMMIWYNNIDN